MTSRVFPYDMTPIFNRICVNTAMIWSEPFLSGKQQQANTLGGSEHIAPYQSSINVLTYKHTKKS